MSWQIDPFHTQSSRHQTPRNDDGARDFTEVSATGTIDPENPENSSITVTIQAPSVQTHNAMRDDDLRSANFWTSITSRRSPSRAPTSNGPVPIPSP